jgi:two-component system, NarL family, sensor histidine kinase DesK
VTIVDADQSSGRVTRLAWVRGGLLLGLLFLIGPISDLVNASDSPARTTAIAVLLATFVALYLALLLPTPLVDRWGLLGIWSGLFLLAAIAGLTLALGAPGSFVTLFVYVVVAAGLRLPAREAGAVIGVTTAAVGTGLAAAGADSSTLAAYILTILTLGATMVAFASATRANRELRAARRELANLAVSEERVRIARDLHDLLGHTLSLIALKSELATKLAQSDPSRAQAEMADVQRVSRQALEEVRDTVQGYRRRAFADELAGARAALSAAGIDCQIEGSATELPTEVEDLLAWALREATTNVVRHSGARVCRINLSSDTNEVALQVDNDGAPARTGSDNGTGLAGLTERARRLDGTLESGARPEGGFRLRLTVPLPAS